MNRTLLLATRNRGKVVELRDLLAPLGIEVLSLADVPPVPVVEEDGSTFEYNARKKALQTAMKVRRATLADDSGLMVDALRGAPGVRSARFAGADASDAENNAHLLRVLAPFPEAGRGARFVAVLALAVPPDTPDWPASASADGPFVRTFRGELEGRIVTEPRGEEGFGYDPLFVPEGHSQTLAELGKAVKNRISHRACAMEKLQAYLAAGGLVES